MNEPAAAHNPNSSAIALAESPIVTTLRDLASSHALKPGWQTTEFWLFLGALVALVAALLVGRIPGEYAVVALGLIPMLYAQVRSSAKSAYGDHVAEKLDKVKEIVLAALDSAPEIFAPVRVAQVASVLAASDGTGTNGSNGSTGTNVIAAIAPDQNGQARAASTDRPAPFSPSAVIILSLICLGSFGCAQLTAFNSGAKAYLASPAAKAAVATVEADAGEFATAALTSALQAEITGGKVSLAKTAQSAALQTVATIASGHQLTSAIDSAAGGQLPASAQAAGDALDAAITHTAQQGKTPDKRQLALDVLSVLGAAAGRK